MIEVSMCRGDMMRKDSLMYPGRKIIRLTVLSFLLLATTVSSADEDLVVIVKPGETLSKISWAAVGIRERYVWEEIARYNDIDLTQPLVAGTAIRIPAKLLANKVLGEEQVSWITQSNETPDLTEPDGGDNTDVPTKPSSSDEMESDVVNTPLCEANENCGEVSFAERPVAESVNDSSSGAVVVQPLENSLEPEPEPEPEPEAIADQSRPGDNDIVDDENQDAVAENQQDAESSVVSSQDGDATSGEANEGQQQSGQNEVQPLPGMFDVDEDAAVRALERSLVQLNALLLDKGSVEIGVEYTFSYNSTLEPVLIFPSSDEEGETGNAPAALALFEDSDSQQFIVLDFKVGLPGDSQLSLALPFEVLKAKTAARVAGLSVDSESQSLSDVGDYSVGFTKALFYEKGRIPDLLFNLRFDGDSGRESGALRTGSGANELTVGFNATKRQDPLVFTFAVSHSVAENVDGFEAGSVSRLSVGTLLAASPYTSLQLEFDQAFIRESSLDGVTLADTDASIGSMLIGASSVLTKSLFLSAGLRVGLTENATDYQFSLGLSRRFGY